MKIRNGFVSNSSSASFILTITEPWKEVLAMWQEEFFDGEWQLDKLKEVWVHDLEETETSLKTLNKKYKHDKKLSFMWMDEEYLKELVDLREKVKIMPTKTPEEQEALIELYLEKKVRLRIKKMDTATLISWDTTMLNSYGESTPTSVKDLLLIYIIKGRANQTHIEVDRDD